MQYFTPHPLPPKDPELYLNGEMIQLYGEANFALGQLNEMAERLPNPERFIKAYIIKEALLSSAIEGIHTSLIDVFTQPLNEAKPNKETQLVLNYTKSLSCALQMIQEKGLPISSRVLLAAHEALMSAGEGERASPGQYRKQAVRVGSHIPPLAPKVPELMGDLEKYINGPADLPPLIKAGLVHVQFETIHPFLDGNGRIGRLLIVLMLIERGLLSIPILYPSYYFK
jgi:Fic family protein